MQQTLNIVEALGEEVSRLEGLLALDSKGGEIPGQSQITRIKALISDLKREIELNTPRS